MLVRNQLPKHQHQQRNKMCSKKSHHSSTAVSLTSTEGTDLEHAKESNVIEEIRKALENHDTVLAATITQKYLEDKNNIPLNIAVTGESGSGKSTFVNAFRGIDNKDDGAAHTGVVETTMKPEPYPHPMYPNVTLWDLPGIGTTRFPADQYLKSCGFEKFDFFIIVSAGRFRENDAKLAQEIRKMGKNFYFIRSKTDNNLQDAERSQREYDEKKTLRQIRKNCIQELQKQGVASPQVFLVSHFDLHLYDFPALQETMERELPSHKKDVLILALPNISKSAIYKKKAVYLSKIKYYALMTAAVAAVPIPGLSFSADLGVLVTVLTRYLFGFGLNPKSLKKLSSSTKKPLACLKADLKFFCSGKDVTKDLLVSTLRSLPLVMACEATKEVSMWIPLLGPIIAASLSLTSIYVFLSSSLDSLAVDAENVLIKAFEMK